MTENSNSTMGLHRNNVYLRPTMVDNNKIMISTLKNQFSLPVDRFFGFSQIILVLPPTSHQQGTNIDGNSQISKRNLDQTEKHPPTTTTTTQKKNSGSAIFNMRGHNIIVSVFDILKNLILFLYRRQCAPFSLYT